eukprot:9472791-Lingulodinium_polyedra.AAC.1
MPRVPKGQWREATSRLLSPLLPEDEVELDMMPLRALRTVKPSKEYEGYQRLEFIVGSGAAASVIPEKLLPDHPITPGDACKKGVHYLTADGGRVPNLGETKLHFETAERHKCNLVFQVADIKKPILS